MTLIKICGLPDPPLALEAARAGADLVGIMFAESRRRVTPENCMAIVEAIEDHRKARGPLPIDGPAAGEVRSSRLAAAWAEAIEDAAARWRPLIVGVFADQTADEVNEVAQLARLDLVQLSGDEDAEFIASIERPVLKAVHIGDATTAAEAGERLAAIPSAGYLLDTAVAGARGGTGTAFDWAIAAEVARQAPFLLAGGLTAENVGAAIAAAGPWGVDVSSGVETHGAKDAARIRAFIAAARGH